MRIIKPSVEYYPQEPGLIGVYKQIERAGRLCYHSEDKITDDSAEKFVKMLEDKKHGAMLEHGTVYLKIPLNFYRPKKYNFNKYSKVIVYKESVYITTNYRVIVENEWLDDLKYLCEPTEHHEKRYTFLFHTDRTTGESFLRHRTLSEEHLELEEVVEAGRCSENMSFARQSTRFCNYIKNKFEHSVRFIQPTVNTAKYNYEFNYEHRDIWGNNPADVLWMKSCCDSEENYFALLEAGWQPQNARYALNFSLYSPLVMTGFESDWKHFLQLRCSPSAHPDAQFLANQVKDILKIEL